jgi:hypothetical protein
MTLRYRKMTATGDYVFGQSNLDFYRDLDAVRQAIQTRLDLYLDTFWRDLGDGVPMFQSILGQSAGAQNIATIDQILRDRIINTTDVTDIVAYSSSFDRTTRRYSFTATVQTVYSETVFVTGVL